MTNPVRTDVVIVGGGAIGCAIAREAAVRGLDVMVVERDTLCSGSSSANPGVVALVTKAPGLTARLAKASVSRFHDLAKELEEFQFLPGGSLLIFESSEERSFALRRADDLLSDGVPVEILGPDEAKRVQPLLEGDFLGAVWSRSDATVDPTAFTFALANSARASGAQFLEHSEVVGVDLVSGRVNSIRTRDQRIECRWLVNAAGVWSSSIGRMVGRDHQVVPRRGQLFRTGPLADVALVRVTSTAELMAKEGRFDAPRIGVGITPKPDGSVIVGGSHEPVALTDELDRRVLPAIALRATKLFPRLVEAEVTDAWSGHRPHSLTGSPLMGADREVEGYIVATGHGGDGIALAPVTGAYVGELLASGNPMLTVQQFLDTELARLPRS